MPISPFPIRDDAPPETTVAEAEFVVLYKHSPTCGLCDIAIAEIHAFTDANPELPVWMVDVLAQRPLSQRLEQVLGVLHESPQVIVVRNGEPVWNGSHRRVTRARLEAAIAALA